MTFHEGDVVRLRLPGGGGHGDPARRRRERVEADLKAGYVTPEAEAAYRTIAERYSTNPGLGAIGKLEALAKRSETSK